MNVLGMLKKLGKIKSYFLQIIFSKKLIEIFFFEYNLKMSNNKTTV